MTDTAPPSAMIEREWAERFAQEWIAAWNSGDLERILSYYEDDFEMCSPLIVERMNEPSGCLRDRDSPVLGSRARSATAAALRATQRARRSEPHRIAL